MAKRKRKKPQVPPTADNSRVTPAGQRMGALMAQIAEKAIPGLIAEGEWQEDERCKSCAFRVGTVPNGCVQTQCDVTKAVMEKAPFMCHVVKPGQLRPVCSGWFAAMQTLRPAPVREMPWEYSPPDEPTPPKS